jgi:hypothetical protein
VERRDGLVAAERRDGPEADAEREPDAASAEAEAPASSSTERIVHGLSVILQWACSVTMTGLRGWGLLGADSGRGASGVLDAECGRQRRHDRGLR